MTLPLLLAGPILRRVEPTLVSVWVALREPATVSLSIWEGRVTAGSGNVLRTSEPPGVRTLRVGQQLHIAVALIKIPKVTPPILDGGKLYSYDLQIKVGTQTHTLKSLGLLTSGTVQGRRVEALGFDENILPGFALPPADITDLRVLFGSCRLPANGHRDAMVWIDDLMRDNPAYSYKDALKRPHQLFLGGDQIYADDVDEVLLHTLIELGKTLIGRNGASAVEHLPVDHVRTRQSAAATGFGDYKPGVGRADAPAGTNFNLPADHAFFPAGRRFLLSTVEAQMTSVDGTSHLFSLGEFAAMYLSVWSNAVWPRDEAPKPPALALPTDALLLNADWPDRIPTFVDAPLDAKESREFTDKESQLSPFQNYEAYHEPRHKDARNQQQKDADFAAHLSDRAKSRNNHRLRLAQFESGLAKVRRVLANIPTYMMFDDHDVTDDWNLNPMWYDRVYTTSLGVTTVRNALVSYALFQDWGNDPLRYEKDQHKQLLEQIVKLFPAGATQGPDTAAANAIDILCGFNQSPTVDPLGSAGFAPVNPPLKWHFSVPGPKHLAVALDNRTRRSFVSRGGPPGNVQGSLKAADVTVQTEQIPAGPFTDGKEVLLVIAPLQVVGPPILDELVAPAAYRVFDAKDYNDKLNPGLGFGSRGMPGTNPDAIEAWAFDPKTMEALLRRLEPYRRVVLLSGDVHYSASNVMSYWKKGTAEPARIVQFTSSGFKNVMPSYITDVDRSMAIAHRIVRAKIGAERLGWFTKPANPVLLPPGKSEKDIARALRAKSKLEPTLLPTFAWPPGSTVNPAQLPDWSWRVEPIFDLRPDAQRPPGIRPSAIDAPAVKTMLGEPNAPRAIDAYQAVASQHQFALQNLRNSRQILFRSNFGAVRFERRAGVLHAIHEMYTAAPAPENIGTDALKPELFVLHEAALAAPQAVRPENTPLQPSAPPATPA